MPGPPELCSKRCFVLTLYCHQMIRFVWGCFNLPELCSKMGSSCYDRLSKKQTFKVWYSFVAKHFHQNMFTALKTINITWFQSFSQTNWQFLKKSILFFKLNIQHASSAHCSGIWDFYHWWQRRKLLCLLLRLLRTGPLSECQSQSFSDCFETSKTKIGNNSLKSEGWIFWEETSSSSL